MTLGGKLEHERLIVCWKLNSWAKSGCCWSDSNSALLCVSNFSVFLFELCAALREYIQVNAESMPGVIFHSSFFLLQTLLEISSQFVLQIVRGNKFRLDSILRINYLRSWKSNNFKGLTNYN